MTGIVMGFITIRKQSMASFGDAQIADWSSATSARKTEVIGWTDLR